MFEFKRNHIIVTVLVFMIAIAAFLTLEEGPTSIQPPQTAEAETDIAVATQDVDFNNDFFNEFNEMNTLSPDAYDLATGELLTPEQIAAVDAAAMNDEAAEVASTDVVITKKSSDNQEGTEVVSTKGVEVSYFAEEKMLREQARAAQIEQLTEYVSDQNMDADTKAKAAENLLLIQDRIEKESGAEALLRAKGFKDVFVRMDDDTVDVVVNSATLTDEQVAQIEEIVQRKTGYTVGQVKISFLTMNKETAEN